MELSLRANLTIKVTLLVAATLGVLATVAFVRARETVEDLSGRIVRLTTSLTRQRVTGLMGQAESQGRLLSGLIAPGLRGDPTAWNARAFQPIAKRMLAVMAANPEFGSVGYTLDRTGEWVQAVRRANGEVTVFTSTAAGIQEFRPYGDELRPVVGVGAPGADVRVEAWYRRARDGGETVWSGVAPAALPTGGESPQATCATPVYDLQNRFLGVVSVSFGVTELSRFLQTIQVGRSGYAFLIEDRGDAGWRVIAHPDANRLVRVEGGRERLVPTREFADPALAGMLATIGGPEAEAGGDRPLRTSFSEAGIAYVGGFQRVGGGSRPDWGLAVVMRDAEFMEGVWEAGWAFGGLGLGALGLAVVLSLILARSVAEPLRRLAAETGRIRAFDLAARPAARTGIREIDALAEGMEQMKTGLRSLEKLVPAEYARWLVRSGQEAKLGGERRPITTSFADIIGFTALSERMPPERLVEVLVEYLDVLSGEVLRSGGTIDKFNGDDVMAFWGAPTECPDHAFLACRTALRSQAALEALHPVWAERGIPVLRASFGVSTGDVVVGNVGSRQRMNYTVIGDAVNLANRLQGLNKRYGTEILVSEQTRAEAGERVVARLVDWADVEGRAGRVPVYELLALTETADPPTLARAARHAQGVALLADGWFREAAQVFSSLLAEAPSDRVLAGLLARAEGLTETFSVEPPEPGLGLDRG